MRGNLGGMSADAGHLLYIPVHIPYMIVNIGEEMVIL
jgi:uncharacterized RmlC-like cupin family protein